MTYRAQLDRILYKVARPAAYIGSEINCRTVDDVSSYFNVGVCYPDLYEIGQSNLGLNVVYGLVNKIDGMFCDRVFSVRDDLRSELAAHDLPLATLSACIPLHELDVLGFTLQSELNYTNLLDILELGKVPLRREERNEGDPVVIAGGPLAFMPEPLSPFIDVFFVGDGDGYVGKDSSGKRESGLEAVLRMIKQGRENRKPRSEILRELLPFEFLYIPAFYVTQRAGDYEIPRPARPQPALSQTVPVKDDLSPPPVVKRLIASDLNDTGELIDRIVPYIATSHDRLSVEVMRGCTRGCRFCFAGMVYRPFREKDRPHISAEISDGLTASGYGEYSLASLSTSDHSDIAGILRENTAKFAPHKISAALPSLRLDSFDIGLAKEVQQVKRMGLTFAPEAGSARMRRVINKNLGEEDLENTMRRVFSAGWQRVKLYFMIGLPGETDEDIIAIADLSVKFLEIGKAELPKSARGRLKIAINLGTFVPKPHTPFQWAEMIHPEEALRKIRFVKERIGHLRSIEVKWQDPWMSFVEAMISRGDRLSGELIEGAHKAGARFDQWSEHFDKQKWISAAASISEEPGMPDLILRALCGPGPSQELPWDHIDSGADKEFLLKEWEKAAVAQQTEDCRTGPCTLCGVCIRYPVKNVKAGQSA